MFGSLICVNNSLTVYANTLLLPGLPLWYRARHLCDPFTIPAFALSDSHTLPNRYDDAL